MSRTGKPARILVLDADLIPALTVVRSLVRQHYLVDVASTVDAPIASFSRGVAETFCYPDPLQTEKSFLNWMQQHLGSRHYDLIIPVSERSLVPLSAHRQSFPDKRFAMAEEASLRQVLDKAETFRLAENLELSVPHSIYLDDINQLAAYSAELTYPVVVKPSHSVAAGTLAYSKRNVCYAGNESELRSQCEQGLQHSPVLLQTYFQGQGTGIELIASKGEILYPFQHLRLHEVPLSGGGSSFRVSTEIEPVLLQAAEKLISALHWTGVAMVEFKWDPQSGRYSLMEINGRLWGSLPLAVAAGADFPAMLAELSLTGKLSEYPAYRRGVFCRNLVRDLMWHELLLRKHGKDKNRDGRLMKLPSTSNVLKDLSHLFSPRHYFDTQSFRDPLPGLVEIKRLFINYGGRFSGLISAKYFSFQQRLKWRNGTVQKNLLAAKTVLFICYGNINRSAVAEIIMTSLLPGDCQKRVLSAGFHHEEMRPVDERMRRLGDASGFDLSPCRSTSVNNELVTTSDIIFVMEKKHRDDLLVDYPGQSKKIFLLGPGSRDAGRGVAEIADPYNQSEEVYRRCFTQIYQAVVRLNETLQADHVR